MIRALVFIAFLGMMISSGVLIGNRDNTSTDSSSNGPPSLQQYDSTFIHLPPSDKVDEAVIHIE